MNAIAIEPYKALIVAMIEQAIRDIRHGQPEMKQSAYRWLQHDPGCVELCDSVGLNLEALTKALEREWV